MSDFVRKYHVEIAVGLVVVALLGVWGAREHGANPDLPLKPRERVNFSELKPGMIIEVLDSEASAGKVRVKVLKVEDEGVHIRLMSELSDSESKDSNEPQFKGAHLPLSKSMWNAGISRQVGEEPVKNSELDGYLEWKDAGGKYFDLDGL